MGGARYDATDFDRFSKATTVGKSTADVFVSRGMRDSLDPRKMPNMMRESRDDATCPASSAIIVGLDVTGSMSFIPDYMVRNGLPALFENIYDRKPVSDPHIMFMAIGDVDAGDNAPLQMSQFEAGMSIGQQLTDIFLEGRGGGNSFESYMLPWYAAAMHTSIDCFEKRGKKGYLFTIGDEMPMPNLRSAAIERVFGTKAQQDFSPDQLLDMVSRSYNVFHIVVEETNTFKRHADRTTKAWADLLGQNALHLSDHTKLSEVIVSAIQTVEGDSVSSIVNSWADPGTRAVVATALGSRALSPVANGHGVVRL